MTDTKMAPTEQRELWKGKVLVFGFGQEHGGFQIGDFHQRESFIKVAKACNSLGIKTVFCTQADEFSATICRTEDFTKEFVIDGVTIKTGVKASGCLVPKNSAAFRSTADCPTMITRNLSGEVIVAHAGRDELIDRHWVTHDKPNPARKYESVVDAMAAYYGWQFDSLEIWSGFGIREGFRHALTDPNYGRFNERLRQYVESRWDSNCLAGDDLEIHKLISDQWENRYGTKKPNSDWIDTRKDIGEDGKPIWYSRSRDPRDNKTNGIFVVVN